MTITSNDINNQRFSIDRKGYDVDEVDVFLEFVADELDEMNAKIAELGSAPVMQGQLQEIDTVEYDEKIAEQEGIIAERDEKIVEQESTIGELRASISEQASHIVELENQLDAAIARASQAETEAASKTVEITQEQLDERDARIAELENELAAKDSSSAGNLGTSNARVLELEAKIGEIEAAAKAELDARIAQIEGLNAKVTELGTVRIALSEKNAKIAELEKRLKEADSESHAISQALVVAQQSADEILEKSKQKADEIVDQAKNEAEDIRQGALAEKQKIIDATADYREKRNEAQNAFRATLEEIIEDANGKLNTLTSDIERRIKAERDMRRDAASMQAYQNTAQGATQMWPADAARFASPNQAPIMGVPNGYQLVSNYVTPVSEAVAVNPAQVAPTGIEKDMSGYGDTGVYDFDDID